MHYSRSVRFLMTGSKSTLGGQSSTLYIKLSFNFVIKSVWNDIVMFFLCFRPLSWFLFVYFILFSVYVVAYILHVPFYFFHVSLVLCRSSPHLSPTPSLSCPPVSFSCLLPALISRVNINTHFSWIICISACISADSDLVVFPLHTLFFCACFV